MWHLLHAGVAFQGPHGLAAQLTQSNFQLLHLWALGATPVSKEARDDNPGASVR